ncbi:hypothetical protein E3N88_13076 [Mikania micrantha]|uniref:Leucine-rich repeat-containing N-terminal plant-type domain-containing protein n=1 Tax=Mikania micrantha TaxID=192012 RepID=A0A5N6P9U8_9ASTR|nr:hypothetical protein E3N88_13076 [Mikania micrantha]
MEPSISSSSSATHFLIYGIVIYLSSTIISGGNETDHEALLQIRSLVTLDPYGALSTWNNSLHFCDWDHVYCGKRHRRVTYIELESNGVEGSLSPYVGNLSFLRRLSLVSRWNPTFLGESYINGSIPHTLGHLKSLKEVLLGSCNLSYINGTIPRSIGSLVGLETLILGGNQFVGNIPSTIGNLQKQKIIQLGENQLSGQIPDAMGNLSSLISLDLSSNMLEGVIPSSLGNCRNMLALYLYDNKLSGKIPTQLLQVSSLSIILDLSKNKLFGSLPTEVGDLNMLTIMDLYQIITYKVLFLLALVIVVAF